MGRSGQGKYAISRKESTEIHMDTFFSIVFSVDMKIFLLKQIYTTCFTTRT